MRWIPVLFGMILFLSACAPANISTQPSALQETEATAEVSTATPEGVVPNPSPTSAASPTVDAQARINVRVDDPNTYNFPQLIPPDGIRPVYAPMFLPADQVTLQAEELILGVAIDGEAKAYPITVLRIREMVNDELAGIPILVTW